MRAHRFDYPVHPAAALFPMLDDSEIKEMAADIKSNGLLNPIVLLKGAVLDGRNRLKACEIAGIKPRFTQYTGSIDPVFWVISQNCVRRNLTPSQRAIIAVEATELLATLKKDAKQRQKTASGNVSRSETGNARDQLAKVFGTNGNYVQRAQTIKNWCEQKPTNNWVAPSKPRLDFLEIVRDGLESIPSLERKIEYLCNGMKNTDVDDPYREEAINLRTGKDCPTGQLAKHFVALIPKHSMELAYADAKKFLQGEKLARLESLWKRMGKEYNWNTTR